MWHWVNRLMMSRMQQWAVKHEILIVHDSAGNYGKCRHMSVMLWSHKVKINKSVKKKLLEKKINQWQHNDGEMHTDLWPPWFYVLLYNAHTHTHTQISKSKTEHTTALLVFGCCVCVCVCVLYRGTSNRVWHEWAGHTEGLIHYHLFNYITVIKASQSDQAAQSRFTGPSAIVHTHTPLNITKTLTKLGANTNIMFALGCVLT